MNKTQYVLLVFGLLCVSLASANQLPGKNRPASNPNTGQHNKGEQSNQLSDVSGRSSEVLSFTYLPELPLLPLSPSTGGPLWTANGNNIYFLGGNVAVGTTPQSGMTLAVNGKIHTKELIVDLNVPGPDYVFDKDYDLLSLQELEAFIKANKHLPEIPSATSMEKEKIPLSEMNMLILKKVEELTLYIIDHEKRLNKLQNRIQK